MKNKISKYLENILSEDIYLVNITVSNNNNHINVYLDGDSGITVDTCGKISRDLEEWLDLANEIPQGYTLNVSSAGIDHPLIYSRQIKKNVNRNLKVQTSEITYQGKLILVNAKHIALKTGKNQTISLNFKDIKEAKVEI